MTELNFPEADERIVTALKEAVDFVLKNYANVVGIIAGGSILRGEGDERSDIDTFVIIEADYRQRVQKFFNGVRFELFINSVDFVPLYFEEETKDGGPSTAHMLTTGHIILNRNSIIVDALIRQAQQTLDAGPQYDEKSLTFERYMLADRFENGLDLRKRDPVMGLMLIDAALSGMLVYQFKKSGQWVPRHKSLMIVLRDIEPDLAQLVEDYYRSNIAIDDRYEIASRIADYTISTRGFFEWTMDRDYLD